MAQKPVPQISTSASCSVPSAVRTPVGSTAATASVTTATWSRSSAGYQSLLNRIRLQPMG